MGRFEELLLILVVALLLFGPSKLTDLAKAVGGAMREFKKAASGEDEKQQNAATPAATTTPSTAEAKPAEPTKNS